MFTKKDEKKEKRKVSDGILWIKNGRKQYVNIIQVWLIRKNTNTNYRLT